MFITRSEILALATILLSTSYGNAANQNCDIELFRANQAEATSEITNLSTLDLVTESNYHDAQQSASAQYSYYFSGDYHSFDTKRSESRKEAHYHYQHSQSRNLVSSSIDANGLKAYMACLRAGSALTAVLSKSPSGRLLTLRVLFQPTTIPPKPNPLEIQYIGAKPFGSAPAESGSSTLITDDFPIAEKVFLFERLPDQEFVAVLQMKALGLVDDDDIALPAPPKIKDVPEFRDLFTKGNASISQPSGAHEGKSWGPHDFCLNPEAGWTIVPNSQQISVAAPVGCPSTQLTMSNQSTICYTISLSINAGQTCNASWTVQGKQTRIKQVFE